METIKVVWLRPRVPGGPAEEAVSCEVSVDDPEAAWALFDAASGALRAAAGARVREDQP